MGTLFETLLVIYLQVKRDALHADMWGMREGLMIARRQRFTWLILEKDSKVLVDMVKCNCKHSRATPALIFRIRDLIYLP